MHVTFLGSGTSSGVPMLGCQCEVCRSNDPHDRRLRSAALIETDTTRVLIDSGPDIRQQLLPLEFKPLDAILLTHIHYDHVGGLDDLRGFCSFGELNIFTNTDTARGLRRTMPYCFANHLYPGVPLLHLNRIAPHKAFNVGNLTITPINIMHGKMPILGFTFSEIRPTGKKPSAAVPPQLVYITDMKTIDPSELPFINDTDTLIVNALRFGHHHHSHQNAEEACDFAHSIRARQTYLIHLSHSIGLHAESKNRLPDDVALAYDGLEIDV